MRWTTLLTENQLVYHWCRVKLGIRDRDYLDALTQAYGLMVECVLMALLVFFGLPFLLPALLIMLVAKFRSRKPQVY